MALSVRDDEGLDTLAAGILGGEQAPPPAGSEPVPLAPTRIPGLDDGTVGTDGPSLRSVLRRWGAKPLLVLAALNAVDELDRIAFTVLAPDIQRTFDVSDAAISVIATLGAILTVAASVPLAVLGDRRRRTAIAGVTGLVWAGFAFLTGVVGTVWQLVVVRIGSGVAKASVDPVHSSLLADYYPVAARARVYAAHRTANPVANVIGPLVAGGVAALVGGTAGWRWAFIVVAPFSVAAGLGAFVLREPERGGQEGGGSEESTEGGDVPTVPLATAFNRLLLIRSLRYVYFGVGVLGFALFAATPIFSLYLEDHWGLGGFGRGVVFALLSVGAMVGLPLGGLVGDRLFRHNPAWPLFLVGAGIPAYGIVTALAVFLPALWLVVAVFVFAQAAVWITQAPLAQIVAATAPPALRSLAFAMIGIFTVFFGGFLGAIVYGSISDAASPQVALALLWIPGLIGGVLIAYGSRFVNADIAMVVADLDEAERARQRRTQAARNLLEVRNLDFSYGPVQVLFDVNLDVPEGGIFALLGTNGAGKSTLLRAITGLDHPTRGSIRFDGAETTYLETEQLLGIGIAQMPGGKAIFPGLSVRENLKIGAFTFRKDNERVEAEIAQVERWFPVLAERRDQPAATLSGGEQQMLAIGKAFLTRPRLLCIDELSLGLAPTVVASLLDIVREMHQRGTTILIVEQSLNVALSLATTAVFMEKGQVRFVGPARELLERPDLARSVFLEGAGR